MGWKVSFGLGITIVAILNLLIAHGIYFKDDGFFESISERIDLSLDNATSRYHSISNLSYQLTLVLHPGSIYHGYVQISFKYNGTHGVSIDYAGKYLKYVIINNKQANVKNIFSRQSIMLNQLEEYNTIQILSLIHI